MVRLQAQHAGASANAQPMETDEGKSAEAAPADTDTAGAAARSDKLILSSLNFNLDASQ